MRRERERALDKQEGPKDLPFGLYLLFSAMVAIAAVRPSAGGTLRRQRSRSGPAAGRHRRSRTTPADVRSPARLQVGSVFEYLNGNAIFGVVQPDSPLYKPILGLFAVTGLPMAGEPPPTPARPCACACACPSPWGRKGSAGPGAGPCSAVAGERAATHRRWLPARLRGAGAGGGVVHSSRLRLSSLLHRPPVLQVGDLCQQGVGAHG